MWARMMLSEKLKDASRIVAFGAVDVPPDEPHEVVTRARATMLAPRTEIRFRRIAPPPRKLTEDYAATVAVSTAATGSSFRVDFDGRSPTGVARRCTPASEESTRTERTATVLPPANSIGQ